MPGVPAVAEAKEGDVLSVEKTVEQDPPELNEDLVSITFNTKLSVREVESILAEVFDDLINNAVAIIGNSNEGPDGSAIKIVDEQWEAE